MIINNFESFYNYAYTQDQSYNDHITLKLTLNKEDPLYQYKLEEIGDEWDQQEFDVTPNLDNQQTRNFIAFVRNVVSVESDQNIIGDVCEKLVEDYEKKEEDGNVTD